MSTTAIPIPSDATIGQPSGGVPIPADATIGQPAQQDTGVLASVKRNTVGALAGLYHAFTDPATPQESAAIMSKDTATREGAPSPTPSTPTRARLAVYRLLEEPNDYVSKRGNDYMDVGKSDIENGRLLKGANFYASGLGDKALSVVPLLGPAINGIAERFESGDHAGAITDLASMVALENAPEIVKSAKGAASKITSGTAGIAQKVLKGEKVAQAPATEALGKTATETAQTAGVSAPSTDNALKSVGEAGNSIIAKAKSQYQALDEATGGRVQRFQDRLNTIHDKLSELTGTEEDNLKEAKLLQAQKDTEDAMNEAFADAKAKGVDPAIIKQANADFKQGNALKDLDMNIFRSRAVESNTATGESNLVNPQKLLPRLQALYKSGRLTEAFGGDDAAAIDLLKQTSDFARMGKNAARIQKIAVRAGAAVGIGALAREGWKLVPEGSPQ